MSDSVSTEMRINGRLELRLNPKPGTLEAAALLQMVDSAAKGQSVSLAQDGDQIVVAVERK